MRQELCWTSDSGLHVSNIRGVWSFDKGEAAEQLQIQAEARIMSETQRLSHYKLEYVQVLIRRTFHQKYEMTLVTEY